MQEFLDAEFLLAFDGADDIHLMKAAAYGSRISDAGRFPWIFFRYRLLLHRFWFRRWLRRFAFDRCFFLSAFVRDNGAGMYAIQQRIAHFAMQLQHHRKTLTFFAFLHGQVEHPDQFELLRIRFRVRFLLLERRFDDLALLCQRGLDFRVIAVQRIKETEHRLFAFHLFQLALQLF